MKLPKFNNPKLLKQALTHRSAVNEKKGITHNERLEYLGDAVLELVVSEHLYRVYPKKPEGQLTQLRTALVRTETLAELAKQLKIPDQILMSRGEQQAGGQQNCSLLANTFEAIVGALYLDQGLKPTRTFVKQTLLLNFETIVKKALKLDAKSRYQELVQAQGQPTPRYQIVETVGPDHQRLFTAEVLVDGKVTGQGKGKGKQEAEQMAARDALTP